MEDILKFCKENPGSNICEFPFRNDNGSIGRLRVENPFFTEEACEKAMMGAAEGLREAPQKIKKLGEELLQEASKTWEF